MANDPEQRYRSARPCRGSCASGSTPTGRARCATRRAGAPARRAARARRVPRLRAAAGGVVAVIALAWPGCAVGRSSATRVVRGRAPRRGRPASAPARGARRPPRHRRRATHPPRPRPPPRKPPRRRRAAGGGRSARQPPPTRRRRGHRRRDGGSRAAPRRRRRSDGGAPPPTSAQAPCERQGRGRAPRARRGARPPSTEARRSPRVLAEGACRSRSALGPGRGRRQADGHGAADHRADACRPATTPSGPQQRLRALHGTVTVTARARHAAPQASAPDSGPLACRDDRRLAALVTPHPAFAALGRGRARCRLRSAAPPAPVGPARRHATPGRTRAAGRMRPTTTPIRTRRTPVQRGPGWACAAPRDRAEAHKRLAFIYCASGRLEECEAEFRAARPADTTFALDKPRPDIRSGARST